MKQLPSDLLIVHVKEDQNNINSVRNAGNVRAAGLIKCVGSATQCYFLFLSCFSSSSQCEEIGFIF